MSVYNGEDYLSEAIESVLNQTFDDFENARLGVLTGSIFDKQTVYSLL